VTAVGADAAQVASLKSADEGLKNENVALKNHLQDAEKHAQDARNQRDGASEERDHVKAQLLSAAESNVAVSLAMASRMPHFSSLKSHVGLISGEELGHTPFDRLSCTDVLADLRKMQNIAQRAW